MIITILLPLIGLAIGSVLGYLIGKRNRSCSHDWHLLHRVKVYDADDSSSTLPMYIKLVYECTKCKDIKIHKIW